MEAARSALDKINAKIGVGSDEAKHHNIAHKTQNEPNLNTREIKTIAAALNNFMGDAEHAYPKGTRPEGAGGNILTPLGKAAADGDLLTKSSRGYHNYTSLKFGNQGGRTDIINALKTKLGESRTPSPPYIDRVG